MAQFLFGHLAKSGARKIFNEADFPRDFEIRKLASAGLEDASVQAN